jgi:hypothetical protein
MHHHTQLVCWDGSLETFCQGWPLMVILLISSSQVVGITAWATVPGLLKNCNQGSYVVSFASVGKLFWWQSGGWIGGGAIRHRKCLQNFFFFFDALEFELKTSHLLGRYSTTWAAPPALFCDGFFRDRVSQTICLGWLWPAILLISAS